MEKSLSLIMLETASAMFLQAQRKKCRCNIGMRSILFPLIFPWWQHCDYRNWTEHPKHVVVETYETEKKKPTNTRKKTHTCFLWCGYVSSSSSSSSSAFSSSTPSCSLSLSFSLSREPPSNWSRRYLPSTPQSSASLLVSATHSDTNARIIITVGELGNL